MAYALANPIKKISQAGDSNSIWFYTDGDAKATVVASGYFDLSYAEVSKGDVILCSIGVGGTHEIDVITVTSETGATTVTTVALA
jgi:hypothetical protein